MIKIGTRVQVMRDAGYLDMFVGNIGTVCAFCEGADKVGVMFDGIINRNSKIGAFWFDKECVMVISEGDVASFNTDMTIKRLFSAVPKQLLYGATTQRRL